MYGWPRHTGTVPGTPKMRQGVDEKLKVETGKLKTGTTQGMGRRRHGSGKGQAVAGGCAAAVEGGGEPAVPGIFNPGQVKRLNSDHALTLTAGNEGVTGH